MLDMLSLLRTSASIKSPGVLFTCEPGNLLLQTGNYAVAKSNDFTRYVSVCPDLE